MTENIYIGDGAYARVDDSAVEISTSNGYRATNTVVLEHEVFRAMLEVASDQPWALAEIKRIASKYP